MDKPKSIKIALTLLVASAAISFIGVFVLISAFLNHPTEQLRAFILQSTFSTIVYVVLLTFLYMKHNWARIVYTIMFAIGMLIVITAGHIPNIPMMLEIAAVIFLYTKESNAWFKSK